jgi:hypothetical protein
VLVASILGSFVAFLDVSVVNVALPRSANDLGGGMSGPAMDRRRVSGDAGFVHPGWRDPCRICSGASACSAPG